MMTMRLLGRFSTMALIAICSILFVVAVAAAAGQEVAAIAGSALMLGAVTQPGGIYKVGDQLLDAEGKPTKRQKAATKQAATSPDEGGGGGTGDALPDDFPAREALTAGGLKTLSQVRAASDEDLDGLSGVGPATVKEIRAAQG